ncbi:hypothetical protein STEG23_014794 [Scotinomys teguina]
MGGLVTVGLSVLPILMLYLPKLLRLKWVPDTLDGLVSQAHHITWQASTVQRGPLDEDHSMVHTALKTFAEFPGHRLPLVSLEQEMAQSVKHLLCDHEDLSLDPRAHGKSLQRQYLLKGHNRNPFCLVYTYRHYAHNGTQQNDS